MIAVAALLALLSAEPNVPVLDISGCEVRPSVDTCVLKPDRKLVILSSGPGDMSWDFDNERQTEPLQLTGTWHHVSVVIPKTSVSIVLHEAQRSRTIFFVDHPYRFADEIRVSGDVEPALKLSVLSNRLGQASARERPYIIRALARLEYAAGRPQESVKLLIENIDSCSPLSHLSTMAESGFAATYIAGSLFDPERAEDLLKQISAPASSYFTGAMKLEYYRGDLAQQTGDLAAALSHFRRAQTSAESSQSHLTQYLGQQLGILNLRLGRIEEGIESLRKSSTEERGCLTARAVANLGWTLLRVGRAEEAKTYLRQGVEELASLCDDRSSSTRAAINLALANVDTGALGRAHNLSATLEASDPYNQLWLNFIRLVTAPESAGTDRALRHLEEEAERKLLWELSERVAMLLADRGARGGSVEQATRDYQRLLKRTRSRERVRMLTEGGLNAGRVTSSATLRLVELLLRSQATSAASTAVQQQVLTDGLVSHRQPASANKLLKRYSQLRQDALALTQNSWKQPTPLKRLSDARHLQLKRQISEVVTELSRHQGLARNLAVDRWPDPVAFVISSEETWLIHMKAGSRLEFFIGSKAEARDHLLNESRAFDELAIASQYKLRKQVSDWLKKSKSQPVFFTSVERDKEPHQESTSKSTTLIVDPESNLASLARLAAQSSTTKNVRIIIGREANRSAVKEAVENSDSLVFVGHHRFVLGESSLALADGQRWSTLDTRSAARVPARVLLIVCSGAGDEHLGLTLADEFLRQGSREVTTTVEELSEPEARQLLAQVLQHGLSGALFVSPEGRENLIQLKPTHYSNAISSK